jgi:hypothetical protein
MCEDDELQSTVCGAPGGGGVRSKGEWRWAACKVRCEATSLLLRGMTFTPPILHMLQTQLSAPTRKSSSASRRLTAAEAAPAARLRAPAPGGQSRRRTHTPAPCTCWDRSCTRLGRIPAPCSRPPAGALSAGPPRSPLLVTRRCLLHLWQLPPAQVDLQQVQQLGHSGEEQHPVPAQLHLHQEPVEDEHLAALAHNGVPHRPGLGRVGQHGVVAHLLWCGVGWGRAQATGQLAPEGECKQTGQAAWGGCTPAGGGKGGWTSQLLVKEQGGLCTAPAAQQCAPGAQSTLLVASPNTGDCSVSVKLDAKK